MRKLRYFCFADSRLRFSYENHKNNGLVEQIFAEDKRLEGLPEDEVYEQRLEHIKPLLERYW